jgi:hypothetical protein
MSKAIQIKVPKPCHENWHNMTLKEQGRFCASCEKIVVDFSKMSDRELLNHLSKAVGQPVCGRFANDQLNRNMAPVANKRRFSLMYVWNLLLATALFFESCNDSTTGEPKVLEKPVVQKAEEEPDTGKAAIAVDTATCSKEKAAFVVDATKLLLQFEGEGKILSRDLKLSEDGWTTMGFSVMESSDGVPVTGVDGLPVWLKQNCFDKEK